HPVHPLITSLVVVFLPASAPPEPSTLSLHDALPIFKAPLLLQVQQFAALLFAEILWLTNLFCQQQNAAVSIENLGLPVRVFETLDRKSTRLNSSHVKISYAVFCLKKKNISHDLCPAT